MPKRKKYPRLPNGFGQIRYLGKGRRNPYGVYPPSNEEYDNGTKKPPRALCYVRDRMVGIAVLTAYHSGTYNPGDEIMIEKKILTDKPEKDFFSRILSDYNKAMFSIETESVPTFEEVFQEYYLDKFGAEYGHKGKKTSMEYAMIAGFKNSSQLHKTAFRDIKTDDIQSVVDEVSQRLSHSSAEFVVSMFSQVSKYALSKDLVEKNYSEFVRIKIEDDDEHGIPFSEDELSLLWDHKENDTVSMLLIMCYSGFRISEYISLDINIKEKYFFGGMKTKAGKGRVVPIHHAILPLVVNRLHRHNGKLISSASVFREEMYHFLDQAGIEKHTPHDCRHTFSALCERYGVAENDRKRMLGHTLDLTNGVYGHRTVDDLRKEIEKIVVSVL